jgi:hypothetical protein
MPVQRVIPGMVIPVRYMRAWQNQLTAAGKSEGAAAAAIERIDKWLSTEN